jgi:hypothetical protein
MKKINFLLITLLLTSSCGGFKEAGKVLRNEKTNSTDEFLVKKREPLILPPDYNEIPEPNSQEKNDRTEDKNRIKKILSNSEKETTSKKSSSTEKSILNRIKK